MNDLTLGLLVAYLGCGCAAAVLFARSGAPVADAAAAVVAWPLWLVLGRPASREAEGPLRAAIERAFDQVRGVAPEWRAELEALRAALLRADARVALADHILADAGTPEGAVGASLQRLREGRDRAAAEIGAVLDELVRVRVQVGLHALSGDARPLRAGLAGLSARVAALDELADLEPR